MPVNPAIKIIVWLFFPEIVENCCLFNRGYSLKLVLDNLVLKQFNGTNEAL
jgi:hypothetical protein